MIDRPSPEQVAAWHAQDRRQMWQWFWAGLLGTAIAFQLFGLMVMAAELAAL